MKRLIIFTISLLLMAPPVLAHKDIIIYSEAIEHTELNTLHQKHHHQQDSDSDKHTKHHHHCTLELVHIVGVHQITQETLQIIIPPLKNKIISFYQNTYISSYLDGIFQPPRIIPLPF